MVGRTALFGVGGRYLVVAFADDFSDEAKGAGADDTQNLVFFVTCVFILHRFSLVAFRWCGWSMRTAIASVVRCKQIFSWAYVSTSPEQPHVRT